MEPRWSAGFGVNSSHAKLLKALRELCLTSNAPSSWGKGPQLGGREPLVSGRGPQRGGGWPQLGGADGLSTHPPYAELSVGPHPLDEAGIASLSLGSPDKEGPSVAQAAASVQPSKSNSLSGQVSHSNQSTTDAYLLHSANGSLPSSTRPVRGLKEWHQSVSRSLRYHLVNKMLESLFPGRDSWCMHYSLVTNNHLSYVREIEEGIYARANSRSEYFHLVAEHIYHPDYKYID